ncbi:hypothetical protein DACRYDRAFT_19774 [Dacryopinax primogenitus]|uniref:Uncharacterized protein n=1 Tax=Dacryopinax primogenitus (strain DJM 731) TaxID=1858805 RepID=M5GGB5_DACPD|nr:uncharacterized protein DACRYDRAFT_19774 [Dacryopinax primogenitus]EJU05198.1 hypothetical protein DACRYDRAFT_19774 [Dacryopinax primogenitus]
MYPLESSQRHILQQHRIPLALAVFDLTVLVFPITLVVSPCLAVLTFFSSVMGSLEQEPVWLSLMHTAVIVQMPLVIACTIENRFIQQQKDRSSILSVSRVRQNLIYLVTSLWLLTLLSSLLAHPSCAEGAPWKESLRPKTVTPEGGTVEKVMEENCTESLMAVGLSGVNALLCLCPVVCTLVVKTTLWRIMRKDTMGRGTSNAAYEALAQQACEGDS